MIKDRNIYNLDTLIKIKLEVKDQNTDIVWWEPVKKSFWNKARPGMFKPWHFSYGTNEVTLESIKNQNCYVEGNKVYYKPYVRMFFQGDFKLIKFFDDVNEANEFLNSIKQQIDNTYEFE